ncbi:MAG: hypothetical protein GF331_14415 [Chitinivibrionales bacterium]|nr:hypothetical protein [Chitinivibrionales bacterium]
MGTRTSVIIDAPVDTVWRAVSDIEHSADMITDIEKVEVLRRGDGGLVGFTWKETRTMFGKAAEETMTVTEYSQNSHYVTEAKSHGSLYTSRVSVREHKGRTELAMDFSVVPVTFSAKVLWCTLGFLFSGGTTKALQKDLEDIKQYVEARQRREESKAEDG